MSVTFDDQDVNQLSSLTEQEDLTPRLTRTRTLTNKGQEPYEIQKKVFCEKLNQALNDIKLQVINCEKGVNDVALFDQEEQKLSWKFNKYQDISSSYINFLTKHRTKESNDEQDIHMSVSRNCRLMVEDATLSVLDRIKALKANSALQDIHDEKQVVDGSNYSIRFSHHSFSAKRSHHLGSAKSSHRPDSVKSSYKTQSVTSSVSSLLLKKRAEPEVARASIQYAKREAGILKQCAQIQEKQQLTIAYSTREKANLNAELKILRKERAAALAEAEVRVLQSACGSDMSRWSITAPEDNPKDRTREYVVQHTREKLDQDQVIDHKSTYDSNDQPTTKPPSQLHNVRNTDRCNEDVEISSVRVVDMNTDGKDVCPKQLNPQAPAYVTPTEQHSMVYATEFSRFLLKKELLFSRLANYDDHPTSYAMWKSGFLGITKELQVTAAEELDLLVKWLGPESSKHARSLRAANAQDPTRGLERVWQRLDERYGCPEMVESALKTKLANFPKLTNKDNKMLYQLSDFLSEIESVKSQDCYKALLGYLDSSSGVRPIVSKLPYGLQEKWTPHAIKYKQSHNVTFPPFTVLVEFVAEASRVKNDPSFVYDSAPLSCPKKGCVKICATTFSVKT